MAFEAESFFGRVVGHRGISIDSPIMTGVTKGRRSALEQGLGRCSVTIMAGQTFAFGGRFMDTPYTSSLLSLIMAVQTDSGGCFSQHSGIFAGMHAVA